jgi:hypothetical protein
MIGPEAQVSGLFSCPGCGVAKSERSVKYAFPARGSLLRGH